MAIDRQIHANASDIDAVRQEAVRKRLVSREWAANTLQDLTKALCDIHALASDVPSAAFEPKLADVLNLLDALKSSSETAAASVSIMTLERQQLASETAVIESEVAQAEIDVKHLRKVLEREKRQQDRRKQYEAVAKLILEWPECEQSRVLVQEAKKEENQVVGEIHELEGVKETLSKEMCLLLHCAAGLERSSEVLATLVGADDIQATDEDAMDTS